MIALMLMARRALLSVWDKRGLEELAQGLARLDIEMISTGGTAERLERAGLPVIRVADLTGFPEILGGRVKTLHPTIHGGILADRGQSSHVAELREHGIAPIDIVVANLYPFREAAATPGAEVAEVIEMIDIGGPTMVRAAAKNHSGVVVVVDPDDYPQILAMLEAGDGQVPAAFRRRLALKAFRHTQAYDGAIARWLASHASEEEPGFPRHLLVEMEREIEPRYGENPHQAAAVYKTTGGPGLLGGMEQLQGKQLSYNNVLDADAARRMAGLFAEPAVVIVKHNNPCGVGVGESLAEAYGRALECDPVSAFGSVIAVNRPVGEDLAQALSDLFVEVLTAPGFSDEAKGRLAAKKNLRLLLTPPSRRNPHLFELRSIEGGFLAQYPDLEPDDPAEWTCPTQRAPTDAERRGLALAWSVCRSVKSNAIVVSNEHQTVGIGAGQMSRVDACRIAIQKAQLPLAGTVAASDAFFPFPDGLETLADAGVTAVVQPGGSKRDDEVVAAADEHDVAMLFTGRRHFRH